MYNQNTLSRISLLIACPKCKQKGYKGWYFDTEYNSKKKAFTLDVHFECCICDHITKVNDNKLKLFVYEYMTIHGYTDDEDDDDEPSLHSF